MKERYPGFIKPKRICVFLLFGILFSLFLVPAEAQLSYGAKGGITVSSFSNTSPHTTVTQGFDIGLFAALPLSEALSIQFEAELLQQGGHLVTVEDYTRLGANPLLYPYPIKVRDSKITINNINVPLMLKYRLISSASLNILLNVGGSAGINVYTHAKETITAPSADALVYVTFNESNGITREYELWQFTVLGGLSFEVPLVSRNVTFDVKYYYGINPVKKGHSYLNTPIIMSDLSTNTLSFTIGTTL